MGTRALIGLERADGSVSSVSVNYDGYPQHCGQILYDSYNSPDKLAQLIKHGNMSSIADTISECEFYCRDRDESMDDNESIMYDSIDKFINTPHLKYYNYLYLFSQKEGLQILHGGELERRTGTISNFYDKP